MSNKEEKEKKKKKQIAGPCIGGMAEKIGTFTIQWKVTQLIKRRVRSL